MVYNSRNNYSGGYQNYNHGNRGGTGYQDRRPPHSRSYSSNQSPQYQQHHSHHQHHNNYHQHHQHHHQQHHQQQHYQNNKTPKAYTQPQYEVNENNYQYRKVVINDNPFRLRFDRDTLAEINKLSPDGSIEMKGRYIMNSIINELDNLKGDDAPLYVELKASTMNSMRKMLERVHYLLHGHKNKFEFREYINIDNIHPEFNIVDKINGGPLKKNISFILNKCPNTSLFVEGTGSNNQRHSISEHMKLPLHIHIITSYDKDAFNKAKKLIASLIKKIQKDHEAFCKERASKTPKVVSLKFSKNTSSNKINVREDPPEIYQEKLGIYEQYMKELL